MAIGDFVKIIGQFSFFGSLGSTIDEDFVYIVKEFDDLVVLLNKETDDFSTSFGSSGSGDGQFNRPQFIANDDSFIYVTDWQNNRVQIFNKATLTFVGKFGSDGLGDGQFSRPMGIAVDDDFIYVSDSELKRVQLFNKQTFAFVDKFGSSGSGDGQFLDPWGLDVDNDFIYVIDRIRHIVQLFDKISFVFIGKFDSPDSLAGQFITPTDIKVSDSLIYVVDSGLFNPIGSSWQIFNKSSFALEGQFGAPGKAPGEFKDPRGISFDSKFAYITDAGNGRIQVFSNAGCLDLPPGPPDSWTEILDALPDDQQVTLLVRTVDLSNGAYKTQIIQRKVFDVG